MINMLHLRDEGMGSTPINPKAHPRSRSSCSHPVTPTRGTGRSYCGFLQAVRDSPSRSPIAVRIRRMCGPQNQHRIVQVPPRGSDRRWSCQPQIAILKQPGAESVAQGVTSDPMKYHYTPDQVPRAEVRMLVAIANATRGLYSVRQLRILSS